MARAANAYLNQGLGTPILIGRGEHRGRVQRRRHHAEAEFEQQNARESQRAEEYADFLYGRLQRLGYLRRDCLRMVHTDRNIFGACMVALGHADAMVTGITRNWSTRLRDVRRVLDPKPGHTVIGLSLVISRGRTILVADTSVHDMPTAEQLADIAVEAAGIARRFGTEPRVAMLAYSTFGQPKGERSEHVREAVACSTGAASISNMTARWPRMLRSIATP